MTDSLMTAERVAAPTAPSRRRPRLVLLLVASVGLLVDLAVQTSADGLAAFAAVVVLATGILALDGVRSGERLLLLAAAAGIAFFLCTRTSPALVALDVVAVAVLLATGASLGRRHRLFDLDFGQLCRLLTSTAGAMLSAPARVLEAIALAVPAPDERRRGQYAAVGRGLGLALPVVLVLGVLLASADAVFASLLDLDLDLSRVPAHVLLIGLGTWIAAGYVTQSSRWPALRAPTTAFTVGPTEGALVLAGLIAVYSLFTGARLVVALRGSDYVLESTGLTYAEYARSGFFQLLWAAGLTLVVLVGLRARIVLPTPRARRWLAGLSLVAVALTLVVVQTAIVRLGLYEQAFGLTLLRFYSTAFAWWVGAVFVLAGLALAGCFGARRWLAGAIVCSAVVALLAVNIADPEARIAERNTQRAATGASFDVAYARSLSDDAVPALVAGLPRLGSADREALLAGLCAREVEASSWNRASQRAEDALATVC